MRGDLPNVMMPRHVLLGLVLASCGGHVVVKAVAHGDVEGARTPDAGTGAEARTETDGLSDASDDQHVRSATIQAWLAGVEDATVRDGDGGCNYCKTPPPGAGREEVSACLDECLRARREPTASERAIFEHALVTCLKRMDESLGRGDARCVFPVAIRSETTLHPIDTCNASCKARALELRRQWGRR